MATTPTLSGPRVASAGGTVPQQTQAFLDAGVAGTPAGQGAGLAAGLREFGQEVGQGADMAARQALQEQALTNEAMARDADTSAAVNLGSIMNEYQSLEGEKAVAAKDAYIGKMTAARAAALDSMPNPETRRMLDGVLSRRMGLYLDGVNRYAAGQQKAWQARSAQGAARVATDQAATFRNLPAVAEGLIESGVASITSLAEIHGWDPDTTTAEQAKYRGNAYQTLISQMLGEGNVDQAAATFAKVRDKLDAGAQAQISQMLKPHQRKQETNTDFAVVMGTGPGTATTIADAIEAQESGGRNVTSIDGARGPRQVMPGTFRQWAQPGESIDNPDDNRTVSNRMLAAYQQQYGGDPERVAVAYFSGPGNVSEPGAPHPWKEDRKDGNGKSVSSYVADISKRLRTATDQVPTYQRPDFDAAREKVPGVAGDDPDRQARLYARINQAETQYSSTTKAEREGLTARLVDIQAALADGRAVAIPETDIRRLYPKVKADEIVGTLSEIQQQGYAMQSVALASPTEFAALLAGYDDVGRAPGGTDAEVQAGYATRAKSRDRLIQAWNRSREETKKDPAVYAGRAPAVQALATQDAISAPGGAEAYARATLGEQERLGVLEADRRVLPKAVTAGLVQKIMEADPEKTPAALVMGEIAKTYGGMWPAVFRDMVRSGLPAGYKVLGSMSADSQVGARADMQRAMAVVAQKGGESALREGAGKEHAKAIDDGLYSAMLPFAATTAYDTGGPLLAEDVRSSIKQLAYYYAGQGASGSQALSRAVTGVLDAKYDFVGTMRVPKGQADLTRDVTRGVQDTLKIEDLAPVRDGPMADGQRQDLLGVAKSGFWVPNANDDGLVLMGTYKVSETGIPVYLKIQRAGGGLVEVKFNQMDAMRNAQRASGVRSPAAEANPWTPPSMMRTFDQ